MAKRTTSNGPVPAVPASAGAGFKANSTAGELAAWADRVGVPSVAPHSAEAQQRPNALAEPRQTFASALPRGPLALGSPGRDLVDRALGMRAAREDDEGTPHVGPLALGSPSRERIGRALDMRDQRADDEGTPHVGPLALGSPGRDRIRQALDMRNAREDDNGTPSQRATFNLQRRQARQAGQQSDGAPALSPEQSRAFNQANQHFEQSHMQTQTQTPDQGGGEGVHRGWSPQARIASARARNVQNLPYGGDPTQAPDYVEPKK